MGEKIIGAVAAMPDEIGPLLRRAGAYRKGVLGGYRRFDFVIGANRVVLVQSGIGPRRAREATMALIREVQPRLLVNFGFAGAVQDDTQVGDLVLAQEVLLLADGEFAAQQPPDRGETARALRVCAALGALHQGVFLTSARIEDKKEVARLLPPQMRHPVLEMETAAVLEAAHAAGIPLVALRGISDGFEEELGFSLEEFCDGELNIRPLRVVAALARKPWIVPQLLRLAANSRKAAERLAQALELLLGAREL